MPGYPDGMLVSDYYDPDFTLSLPNWLWKWKVLDEGHEQGGGALAESYDVFFPDNANNLDRRYKGIV